MLKRVAPLLAGVQRRFASIDTGWPTRKVVENHSARGKYEVVKELEVGLVLVASEVKSIRDGNCDISAAFAAEYAGELYLHQMYIPVWRHGIIGRHETYRERKILAHRHEIKRIIEFARQPNAHLVPLRVHLGTTNWIKIQLGLCTKKKGPDTRKREDERDVKQQIRRALKSDDY
ncbi:SsrA-binding protein [Saprolegnia diclina VS20]|uniref:SsrA-binding protein n=1 Tax=Saprolegnia diclina (strain VS20) TaxID=1156394 RepID=T0QGI8_SAPDV|nr:SsrA-binding protein [Saprolegnia diclina VS20]EQC37079.1 SsrA-binding protein [Saprolegnia diclina VS20]|eukprot:XP_008609241.1 SsrA-binding protein [Saprolegnia diclina VS20]